MALISRAEAARQMGVSVQAVYKAIREGRLTAIEDNDGKTVINGDTLVEEWNKKTEFRRVRTSLSENNNDKKLVVMPSVRKSKTKEAIPDYEESKARTEHLKAELLELDRQAKEKVLVPAAEVELRWVEIVTIARTKLLGLPSKAKQRIPDLDSNAMACLDDIVREALEELSGEGEELVAV